LRQKTVFNFKIKTISRKKKIKTKIVKRILGSKKRLHQIHVLFLLIVIDNKTVKNRGITFSTLLSSRAPCKNSNNTPGLDFVFRTRLLVFPENKIRKNTI